MHFIGKIFSHVNQVIKTNKSASYELFSGESSTQKVIKIASCKKSHVNQVLKSDKIASYEKILK